MHDPDLERAAERLYSHELPYHNFRHALEAVDSGETIVEDCKREGIPVDERVVYCALLFHDAGYHEDHQALGFDCKEAYSARLAADALAARGFQRPFIEQVEQAIMSTHRDGEFVNAEQKAVRAADLAGLGADYEVFRDGSQRLWREHQMLTGTTVSWDDWVEGVSETVGFYISQAIPLTSDLCGEPGESPYHRRIRANLRRLRAEAGAGGET